MHFEYYISLESCKISTAFTILHDFSMSISSYTWQTSSAFFSKSFIPHFYLMRSHNNIIAVLIILQVGLAIGDIKSVEEHAELRKLALKV